MLMPSIQKAYNRIYKISVVRLIIYSYSECLLLKKLNLLNIFEMQTVIKQAICVSVLHMCCKYGNKQHVTKPPRKYVFLPKQPKENTEKITNLIIFYFAWLYDAEIPKLCHYVVSSIVFTNIPRSRNY